MKIILGIGNYGERYEKHYHSLGIIFVKFLINHFKDDIKNQKTERYAIVYEFEKFCIVISKTLMNNSILSLNNIYKIDKLLVAHDELMIKKYKIRIKTSQGNAGHNGLRSIASKFKEFDRLQIGVDHPKNFNFNLDVSSYVLSNIDSMDQYNIEFEKILPEIIEWINN